MAYAYRVTKAFKRVGDDGERQFSIGDTLVLDRPAKSLSHLELIAPPADDGVAVTVGAVQAAPAAQVVQAKQEPSIDDLRERAKALGIKVDGRWSVDRLAAEIEKAQS